MKAVRWVSPVHSRAVETTPGDTLRALTTPAKDQYGETWPLGTEYRPSHGGVDNLSEATLSYVAVNVTSCPDDPYR